MNITNNTALIEPMLPEDLPDCGDDSDVDISNEENSNIHLARDFDDIYEERITIRCWVVRWNCDVFNVVNSAISTESFLANRANQTEK
ncbi:hypothetical protein EVAR_84367_1 [Eumeta japonica]|uniref:Uncharacterized protein n=1 Tax=Eumeta variegata TaxID=151549 RepID=A0A4C1U4H8_EUMVA|nr:hypothetical protein EVAR_84367_1 [Eumeta japonica]